MIRKIIEFIKNLIIKMRNWFKKKTKKTSNVEVKGVVKPKHVILKGSIDIVSSVIGAKNDYHELLPEDIELEIKQFIKEQKKLSSKEITEKIEEFEKKLSILKYKEENKKVQGKKSIEKQKNNLEIITKQKDVINNIKENVKKEENKKEENKKEDNKKEEQKEFKNSIPKIVLPAVLLDTLKGISNIKQKEESKSEQIKELVIENEELEKYKSYIVDANTHLKKYKGLIKEIEDELTKNNDTLDNSKYKVLAIKSKISEIKKSYYDFKHSDYIYVIEGDYILNELDKFNIIKDSKELDNYLNKCNSILAQIEEKKYNQEDPENEIKQTKKEEQTDEKKPEIKEKKEEKNPLLVEIEQASNIIKKDIKNQRKEINKINDKLALLPIHEQKKKRLGFFDNFLSNSFKIGMSLLPIKLFRNRMLGLLTSGFMLNNTIRSMRRIVNPDSDIVYIEMNRRIKNQLDIINSYDTICNDSLYQISSLKEEFSRVYGHNVNDEVNKAFNKILLLEESILEQKTNLYNTKLKLNKKVKVKVKKL